MRARRRGFTLVELMIVMVIIGILISFILKAYLGSIHVAEKSATISLIAKLESALNDRVDALTTLRADPTWAHTWMAAIWTSSGVFVPSNQRAQVIAQYDYMRSELPDVFVVESDGNYPINFGAARFPLSLSGGNMGTFNDYRDYALPLGAGSPNPLNTSDLPNTTGMKGASFAAAASIYKQLGADPKGLNGADDNGNGLIDEVSEGFPTTGDVAELTRKLSLHKHSTARAEMLYAILVEGTGPLGSVFDRDDFNNQEVRDTDGDGLMEFVDAYGQPLQFFRWPIMYRSDTQKGFPDLAKITQDLALSAPIGPYYTVYESREQDPLDPNQTLQSPGWWGSANASYPWGSPRATFGALFHTLVDPLAVASGSTGFSSTNTQVNTYWDRSGSTGAGFQTRRAYYSRFLVLSGGPDKLPGVAQLGVNYAGLDERSSFPIPGGSFAGSRDGSGAAVALNLTNVITVENQGGKIDPVRTNGAPAMSGGRNDTNTLLEEFAQDDISNHNLHSAGGPLPTTGK